MSLTLPTAYSNSSKLGNIQENWIVQLGYDDEGANDWTGIALSDTTVGGVFYHGAITNKPSIRSSIDLATSTAKTGNISLSVINFQFKGDDFSAELFLGTRKYINRNVKIYSQLNGDTTLANCLQIYQGRLIDISHDADLIKLSITEQRPWDFISIPQDKSSNGIFASVAYGDFTRSTNPAFANNYDLYPMPFVGTLDNKLYFAEQSSVSSSHQSHFYDSQLDKFTTINSGSAATSSFNSLDCVNIPIEVSKTFRIRPESVANVSGFSDVANAINGDSSDGATAGVVDLISTGDYNNYNEITAQDSFKVQMPEIDGGATSITIYVLSTIVQSASALESGGSISGGGTNPKCVIGVSTHGEGIKPTLTRQSDSNGTTDSSGTNINLTTGVNGAGGAFGVTAETINYYNDTKKLDDFIVYATYYSGTGDTASTDHYESTWAVTIKDIIIQVTYQNDLANEPTASYAKNSQLKFLYSGTNGLTESWTGSNNAIQYGHEAHRDMLIRFAGYTTTDPGNWSALDEDRTRNTADSGDISTWKIRWWEIELVELKKVLDQLQYEFGFIFKFRADGTGSYIHILQTSELSAVQTFKKDDIANLKINNSSFSGLLTKMEINYEKHPAENRYFSSVTSSNSTARTNYNIQAKENIKEVNLDMNVGTPNASGQTDGNADFYSYYDNIFGDIKKIIDCQIINSAKAYSLETGDIVQFSNTAGEMPVDPFGDNWADYYMIIDLKRSPGNVSITAREVG